MVLIVLIQEESKGGGLTSNFSSTNSIMGVRKTTDVVEKITWTLAGLMVVISVVTLTLAPQSVGESSVMEGCTQLADRSSCYARCQQGCSSRCSEGSASSGQLQQQPEQRKQPCCS